MPDSHSSYFPTDGMSARQQRIADLVDEGRTVAEATGHVFAEQAGFPPPPASNAVDEPGDAGR